MAAAAGDNAGTMTAVKADAATCETIINELHSSVVVANRNTDQQTVCAGSDEAIAAFETACKEHKIRARRIPVAAAFHSPLVADATHTFAENVSASTWNTPSIPVYLPTPRQRPIQRTNKTPNNYLANN